MRSRPSRLILVILILALVLAWLILDQTESANPIRNAVSTVLSPVQFALERLVRPLRQALSGVGGWFSLRSDNAALSAENLTLRNQIVLLEEARLENETLRRQLDFKSAVPSYTMLPAEVIGRDPSVLLQFLIIDRGSADGIAEAMPVLTAEALVGRISEVSTHSAKVMLISDPSSSVSCVIQRTRATGVVQGYPENKLVMRYIPQGDTVAVGDMVLTSGLGGNFPKRLVVGQVERVASVDVEMFQEATVKPAVSLADLEVVMVLLDFGAGEQTDEP
jgi:rod shape-determining protein MreC